MKFKQLKLVMKESEELKDESVVTRTAAEEIINESDEDFKTKYAKSFNNWKKANPNKSDKEIIDILKAKQYDGELHEEAINESDEEIMELVQNSIVDGKLPDEIEYKGKTYKQFNVMSGDTTGETSDIYYCNMDNTPSGDPQESNDYFFVKVVLNKTNDGYKGVKEVRFVEDLTEKAKLTEENVSFEEIIEMMSNAESYEELYSAAENIANIDLKDDVIKFIQQCEDDGDSVEEAYSIVTTDLLDDKVQDLNEDAYITINDGKHEDEDYLIQDVTELEDLDDSDVEAPSIEGLLSLVNESLSNKYGDTWGYMKSKSISMKENLQYAIIDIVTPSVLREAEERKIKDKAVSKTVILESVPNSKSLVNLKINTLAGTTRFSQKTREPAKVLTRWLESEYLYDEMVKDFQDKLAARQATLKDSTEAYLKQHPDLKIRINTIKAQEKMLKDAGMLDDNKEDIARLAYAIAAEFPANVNVKGNKDNDYEMEFDTIDEIVKMLFGESYVKEISKEEKDLAKKNKKVLKDNSLKEGALPNISKFIYDLDKDRGNAWSAQSYTKDGNGNKIIIVSKNGQSDNTAEDIKNEVENKYQNLKGEITENGNNVWFYLKESSLKEGYEAFKIGEIEGVFNPSTGEAMYSIPSKNVTDKKLNLEKIPSVETPYDTDTIIKDYIERTYGTVQEPTDDVKTDVDTEPETAEDDKEVMNEENIENVIQEIFNKYRDEFDSIDEVRDIADTLQGLYNEHGWTGVNTWFTPAADEEYKDDFRRLVIENNPLEEDDIDTPEEQANTEDSEPQAETGTASFFKIRQRDPISINDLNEKAASGVGAQESEYIVVKEINLSEDEAQDLMNNLSKPQNFLQGIEPIDRKNYAFNPVKVNTPSQTLLIDPVGYGYPRYVALI